MMFDIDNNDADDIHRNGGDADTKSDAVEHASRSGAALCYFPVSGHDGVPSRDGVNKCSNAQR